MTLQKAFQQSVCFCSREPEIAGNKPGFATDPEGDTTENKVTQLRKSLLASCPALVSSGYP